MTGRKILYITRIINGKNHIFEKIIAQCDGLKNIGFDVDIVYINEKYKLCFNDSIIGKLNSRIGIQLRFFNKISHKLFLKQYDLIYIRNPFVLNQISYLNFLKSAKNEKCKIILEIPTYPYDLEIKDFWGKIIFLNEKLFKSKLKKYISQILYSGNDYGDIYGIKCKQLLNVVNAGQIPVSKSKFKKNSIKLLGVSSCNDYHGYDRIIEGLYLYYKNYSEIDVEFHIIGNGPEYNKYLNLINNYSLDRHVKVHGKIYGDKLNNLFDNIDIGVSCLGMHRIGLNSGSPLKSAEYAVRGIPFLLAYNDSFFSGQDFCFNVPANDTPVIIQDIVYWYLSKKFDHNEIRDLSVKNISWEKQFETIISDVLFNK